MRLTQPTDFIILDLFSDGERYTPSYAHELLVDEYGFKESYVRNRVWQLHGEGLLEKLGDSSMYVITALGREALAARDEYTHDSHKEFEETIRTRVDESSSRNGC